MNPVHSSRFLDVPEPSIALHNAARELDCRYDGIQQSKKFGPCFCFTLDNGQGTSVLIQASAAHPVAMLRDVVGDAEREQNNQAVPHGGEQDDEQNH